MRTRHKALLVIVLVPAVTIGGYIAYLVATYIDKTVTSGSAYGFNIGSSKIQAIESIQRQRASDPGIALYVDYGPRAGDTFTLSASDVEPEKLDSHDQWTVLPDGPGKFFNTIRLTFREGHLVEIHRHRQYFELP